MNKYEIYYEADSKVFMKQVIAFNVNEAMLIFRQLMGRAFIRGVYEKGVRK